ncbi:MAG: P1 family peptidase [Merdibacter sp.]
MEKGRYNKISDVAGVLVGHRTVEEGDVHTGVRHLPRPQIFRLEIRLPCVSTASVRRAVLQSKRWAMEVDRGQHLSVGVVSRRWSDACWRKTEIGADRDGQRRRR